MSKKSGKIDFNNPGDIESIVNEIAGAKTGVKLKVNLKLIVVIIFYFVVCGLGLNIYWLVNLILKLF